MITAEDVRSALEYNPLNGYFYRDGKVAGYIDAHGYRQISVCGKKYKAHRLVWLWFYGEWPSKVIDHINRNKDDNRIWNLRDVSQKVNTQRRRGGVSYHRKACKYRAYIMRDGKHIHLGLYLTKAEAIYARQKYETDNLSQQTVQE